MNVMPANPETIRNAAALLRLGGLVAFPTETVYGLGANALDAAAVRRVFAAKGRPPANPVIVHIADISQAKTLVIEWPEIAEQLALRFWPGPLTLVLPKSGAVPNEVTASGPTVALRVPAHPVALALLREAGIPVAAPSANKSTELSPTRAAHVARSLGESVDVILDGGPCPGGIESTVLDVTTHPPRLLRPGLISQEQLESVCGPITFTFRGEGPARSPGMQARHYAPHTPLEMAPDDGAARVRELLAAGMRVGWLAWPESSEIPGSLRRTLPRNESDYSAGLYSILHELDAGNLQIIVVAQPPREWAAVCDRLRRAAD